MDFRNLDTLKEVDIHQVDKQLYTATYEGRMFSIGALLFQALDLLKQNFNLDQVANRISTQNDVTINQEQLLDYLNQFVSKIEINEQQENTLNSYVYW